MFNIGMIESSAKQVPIKGLLFLQNISNLVIGWLVRLTSFKEATTHVLNFTESVLILSAAIM